MTVQSVLLLEARTSPCRELLKVKQMGDGDGKTQKFAVCCFDTKQEESDEQCGARCGAITCSIHGSVVFPCGTCGR